MFQSSQSQKIKDIPAVPMTTPFTEDEISGAVKSLKNSKSPGTDDIRAEHLKSGPKIVNENIARRILNHVAASGELPSELKTGILVPLQKPGKSRGPPSNLRPFLNLTNSTYSRFSLKMSSLLSESVDGKSFTTNIGTPECDC